MGIGTFVALTVVLTFSLLAFGGETNHAKGLDGTWQVETAELGGKPLSEEICKATRLTISGGDYTVMAGQNPDKGTIKVDASANPGTIDITGVEGPNQGKTILAIYELGKTTANTLRICYDLSGQKRPTEFKTTEGSALLLINYSRAKP